VLRLFFSYSQKNDKFINFSNFPNSRFAKKLNPMVMGTFLRKERILENFSKRNMPDASDRVPIARRVQSLNVALTMNPLVIFSSLVPDGQKAWLFGGFSARVFYVQRR